MAVQFAGRPGAHQLAVAHHADAIGDFHHFIQPVADEYHADAGRLQLVDHPQQAVDLLAGQRGGRFVHDNQPSLGGDGAANRHQLPIGDRQFFHLFIGIDAYADPRHGVERRLAHHPLAHPEAAAGQVTVDGDVLRHRQVGEQRQVLVDHLYAVITG